MNIIIHDLNSEQFYSIFPDISDDTVVIDNNGNINKCTGCFGCWIKTPGRCVIKDGYENMGELFSKAEKITIICKCTYGCYSPFIKNVLDRALSYFLPSFELINNETHHKKRYAFPFRLFVYFYGENISEDEKKTAESLVKSNSVNYNCRECRCFFVSDLKYISMDGSGGQQK